MTPLNSNQFSVHSASVYVQKIISRAVSLNCSKMFYSVLTGQGSCLNNEAVLLLYPRSGFVSAESWFVKSPLAGPHRHRATHTMTQWRLCGLDQGPPAVGEVGGKAPQNVTDVFVLIAALLLLSFCLSIYRQLIPLSLLTYAHLSLYPLPSNKPVCLSPEVLSCLAKCTGDPFSGMNKLRP